MKKLTFGILLAASLFLGFFANDIIAQSCTLTPNLGLCKGARGAAEWDTFLNANFDLIDSLAINAGSGAQTKTGILSLTNSQPLKLNSAAFQPNDILFLDANKVVTRSAQLSWGISGLQVGSARIDPSGGATITSFIMASGGGAGKVLTSDGSGNGTWQTIGAASSGWTPGTGTVVLSSIGDKVGIGVASPTEKLEVAGGVKLGTAATTQAGVIQWDGSNFRGYTGTLWKNLDETTLSAGGWTTGGVGGPTEVVLATSNTRVLIGVEAETSAKFSVAAANLHNTIQWLTVTGSNINSLQYSLTTWNTTGIPTLLEHAVSDTASPVSARLMRFLVGGNSVFEIRKDGQVTLAAGLIATTGTFSGAVSASTIQLTTGASAGYVLTSDGAGNASWAASAGGSGVPSGMIAVFDASCPSGWTRVSAFDNRFLYGGSSYGATGGAADHGHTTNPVAFSTGSDGSHGHTVPMGTFTSSGSSAYEIVYSSVASDKYVADDDHTHTVTIADRTITASGTHTHSIDVPSTASSTASSLPPYITVVYCKKD